MTIYLSSVPAKLLHAFPSSITTRRVINNAECQVSDLAIKVKLCNIILESLVLFRPQLNKNTTNENKKMELRLTAQNFEKLTGEHLKLTYLQFHSSRQ